MREICTTSVMGDKMNRTATDGGYSYRVGELSRCETLRRREDTTAMNRARVKVDEPCEWKAADERAQGAAFSSHTPSFSAEGSNPLTKCVGQVRCT